MRPAPAGRAANPRRVLKNKSISQSGYRRPVSTNPRVVELGRIILLMGGTFFLYTFCWNVIGFFLMREIKDDDIKDIIVEKGLSSIVMVQLIMIILAVSFIIPSFFALHVPFLSFWYIGFITLLIYILISSFMTYFLLRHLEFKSSKSISLFRLIKILKSNRGKIINVLSGIIPVGLLITGTFMNVNHYWVEGIVSYNLIIFLIFAQVTTFTLLIFVTFINISINRKRRYKSKLQSQMKRFFIDQNINLHELSQWYIKLIDQY
jgi:hypothetical protein